MNGVGMRLSEDAEKLPRCVWQVPAYVRHYGKAFFSHLFAERAKTGNRIDARVVPLFPL
jgi:hypothetical protein